MKSQENQLNRLFDFDTGIELEDSADGALEFYQEQVLKQAASVEAMKATEGWKLLEEFCFDQIEAAKDKLVDAKDLDQIRRYQSLVVCFSNLLGVVDKLVLEATNIRAELKEREIKG